MRKLPGALLCACAYVICDPYLSMDWTCEEVVMGRLERQQFRHRVWQEKGNVDRRRWLLAGGLPHMHTRTLAVCNVYFFARTAMQTHLLH